MPYFDCSVVETREVLTHVVVEADNIHKARERAGDGEYEDVDDQYVVTVLEREVTRVEERD